MAEKLVHKTRTEEVLLTDGIRLGENEFLLTGMLPTEHSFYQTDAEGRPDAVLMTEAFRQAAYYISHRFYGVPNDYDFILGRLAFAADDTVPPLSRDPRLPVGLHVTCTPNARGSQLRQRNTLTAEFIMAGRALGSGTLYMEAVDTHLYRTIRHRFTPPERVDPLPAPGRPLETSSVGRTLPTDVLLSDDGTAGEWALNIDQSHPVMFDHAYDHVPGMVLLEAFRQAAIAAVGHTADQPISLAGLEATFSRFCELDAPIRIRMISQPVHLVPGRASLEIAAVQHDNQVASGKLDLRVADPVVHDMVVHS